MPNVLPRNTRAVLGAVLLAALLGAACTSRYRMELYYLADAERSRIDVEQALFTPATRLNDPLAVPDIVSGEGSTAVITVGKRGERYPGTGAYRALSFDQYLQYRIYLELPSPPWDGLPDTIPVVGRSYVRLMRFYERPPAERTYGPETGAFVIDSVRGSSLYGTFDGAQWVNGAGHRVGFEGRVKMRVK
ncbi:MAG TPA: hypothetical protein PLR32_03900 [candidate division Zixibacteria bacterium]|nr:hypothetical protein [candidate division Zixibacteria bacterium]MDD4916567.1 hypothetical protein [candidate division Zixibacteria bacterium]MDM7974265.1 hypothetical protein [candidate division Zixibacteria bacterium]HOD65754.1 hypothetical protein [candidate division Zixibacteria bacterium]HOZ08157.1 hypothetical protein [candidate division Zixibacteria bacterium]